MSIHELEQKSVPHLPKLVKEQVQNIMNASLLGTLGITIDMDARCMGTQ